jgi:hypothetical protein
MKASFLAQIDWSRPWLALYRDIAAPIIQAPDWRLALNTAAEERGLHNHRNLPIRFVPQAALPTGMAYESFISETGCVPTRDNLHDFFNALVWLTYPSTKARLNALQANAIANAGTVMVRGKLRDAITIFDENAALFVTHREELVTALRQHDWQRLFIEERSAFHHDYTVQLFGHALLEKLTTPYKAITAHVWVIVTGKKQWDASRMEQPDLLDCIVSGQMSANLETAGFMPLPVLGLPGWEEGQNEIFYSDTKVFRSKRSVG